MRVGVLFDEDMVELARQREEAQAKKKKKRKKKKRASKNASSDDDEDDSDDADSSEITYSEEEEPPFDLHPSRLRRPESFSLAENLAYGVFPPEHIVLQLFIDDGSTSRGHRRNLLNEKFDMLGCSVGPFMDASLSGDKKIPSVVACIDFLKAADLKDALKQSPSSGSSGGASEGSSGGGICRVPYSGDKIVVPLEPRSVGSSGDSDRRWGSASDHWLTWDTGKNDSGSGSSSDEQGEQQQTSSRGRAKRKVSKMSMKKNSTFPGITNGTGTTTTTTNVKKRKVVKKKVIEWSPSSGYDEYQEWSGDADLGGAAAGPGQVALLPEVLPDGSVKRTYEEVLPDGSILTRTVISRSRVVEWSPPSEESS